VKSETSSSHDIKQAAKASKYERIQLEMAVDNMQMVVNHRGSTIDKIKEAQKDMKQQLDLYKAAQRSQQMLLDEVDDKEIGVLKKLQDLCLKVDLEAETKI